MIISLSGIESINRWNGEERELVIKKKVKGGYFEVGVCVCGFVGVCVCVGVKNACLRADLCTFLCI